jgi:phosphotransferase system enzyme I (PtsI)
MRTINGIGVSPGVVSAPAFYVAKTKHAEIVLGSLSEILSALESVAKDLDSKAAQTNMTIAKDVIEAQAMIARDPELHSKIQSLIGESSSDLRIVLEKSFEQFKIDLTNLGGYFAERVSDLDEIKHLVVNKLLGLEEASIDIMSDSILVAEDLSPADTATINLKFVKGLVVSKGGPTSHTAIVARNLGIPAIVGAKGAENIRHGDFLLLNGRKGVVIIDPSSTEINSAIKRERE